VIVKERIQSFFPAGFDLYSIGSTKFRNGALLGIPTSYNYTASSDIDRSSIIIRGKNVQDWNSKGGLLLSESLVLSGMNIIQSVFCSSISNIFLEDEQIFGLTREMLYLRDNPVYFRAFCSTGCITAFYILTSALNSKLGLFYRPLSLRAALYCIAGFFIYGIHSFAQDFVQVSYYLFVRNGNKTLILQVSVEGDTDEKLATLGRPFLEAGIRFYDKLLKKNIAIRELTGDESQFTAKGKKKV
jgi:hypothetical protein